ncbi:MAG: hypothetical protein U0R64_04700 [Candidatus Nanopelagicales bacterium]
MGRHVDGTVHDSGIRSRPRLWAGVALIAASAVVGAAALWGGSPAPTAWVARAPIAAGTRIDPASFERASVQVPDPQILWPGEVTPTGVATRSLQVGEPLFVASAQDTGAGSRVTLPVPAELLPVGLGVGDLVDVWEDGDAAVLAGVPVTAVVDDQTGTGRVEVAVPETQTASAVRLASVERLVLVRR